MQTPGPRVYKEGNTICANPNMKATPWPRIKHCMATGTYPKPSKKTNPYYVATDNPTTEKIKASVSIKVDCRPISAAA